MTQIRNMALVIVSYLKVKHISHATYLKKKRKKIIHPSAFSTFSQCISDQTIPKFPMAQIDEGFFRVRTADLMSVLELCCVFKIKYLVEMRSARI